ncbi:MAG: threonine aldolase family protein [Burkholderiaceae bacterium]
MPDSVDLRSDLLSRPTPQMFEAMQSAFGASPGFGLREDPWVQQLELTAAAVLGKEDALFCPTCTLCNQIAINLHLLAGETMVCEATSHVVTSEGGAPAALSGAMVHPLPGDGGLLAPRQLEQALQGRATESRARCSLLVLENTHTRSGGRVLDLPAMRALAGLARERDVRLHLDGARLFNAASFLGCEVAALAADADTVAISLNKGLGAPLGAILAGTREFIDRAVVVRQRLGGGWRPAGVLAAAGLVAIEQGPAVLADDHRRARSFADELAQIDGVTVVNAPVQTNLVLAEIAHQGGTHEGELKFLAANGILALAFDGRLRFAFHNGIDDVGVERAAEALRALAKQWAARPTRCP